MFTALVLLHQRTENFHLEGITSLQGAEKGARIIFYQLVPYNRIW